MVWQRFRVSIWARLQETSLPALLCFFFRFFFLFHPLSPCTISVFCVKFSWCFLMRESIWLETASDPKHKEWYPLVISTLIRLLKSFPSMKVGAGSSAFSLFVFDLCAPPHLHPGVKLRVLLWENEVLHPDEMKWINRPGQLHTWIMYPTASCIGFACIYWAWPWEDPMAWVVLVK